MASQEDDRGGGRAEPASFEANLAKLEELVRRLEEGNLPLDDALYR